MTYEYECDACGHEWEQEQKITEEPVKVCPKCGEEAAKRLVSNGNFVLKGKNWARDGY
ncbi:MAG: zinc ribbon domain-containing protein [bacterium]